jgi:hypothetical protein
MGLRMDDLHTPTVRPVSSGPTSGRNYANPNANKDATFMELMAEKEQVEAELTALSSVLASVFIPTKDFRDMT